MNCSLAVWLALNGSAVIVLSLVVVGALVRPLMRVVRGKHFHPTGTPIA